ncbi:Class IIb bacteriocin, lactobin A/cerein 7B family [Flavobacterium sp. 9R]|uniref:class IIb bacteriocin, lactobin A/cerein 7B family n=1 Tax=Flavobacterium sp. 9R TaxID=2653143 RepID=UPI0012F40E1E|nr:class IIb bacteriocin, lactobin A/cerein 7B family [Flavobacterium sp. 9R]VXB28481.1 Class IIb bacteriocin, lactobin A/cerein 7B family [Flavobacterium sp. 9R]
MEITNYNIEELENKELINIEGGFLQFVLAGIAIAGALYGAGHAVGEAYYHYTHSK